VRHFIEGCGLRRRELRRLCVRDIHIDGRYGIWIVEAWKVWGRQIPVLESHHSYILAAIQGLRRGRAHIARVFPSVPALPDWYQLRRISAQSKYRWMVERGCDPQAEQAVIYWLGLAAHPNTARRLYLED
jgi:integrase